MRAGRGWRGWILVLALALAGCGDAPGGGGGGLLSSISGKHAPRSLRLAGIRVRGPDGFCVDRASISTTAQGSFVALGACAAISGNPDDARPAIPAILGVAVTRPAAPPDPAALKAYFTSPAGRAALAQSGRAGDVSIRDTLIRDGVLYLLIRDTSDNRPQVLAPEYRRAFVGLRGRLVSLSLRTLNDRPVSDVSARRLMRDFVQGLSAANGGVQQRGENPEGGLRGLFNRLL